MKDTWDLTKIYPSEADFDTALKLLKEAMIPQVATFKGKLANENSLMEFLSLERKIEKTASRLWLYAECSSDTNKKDVKGNVRVSRVQSAFDDLSQKASFADAEILSLGQNTMTNFFVSHPDYRDFDYAFKKLFLERSHVLSEDKEKILSTYSPLLEEGARLYSSLTVADYTPKKCVLSDKKEVEVSQSNWSSLIEKTPVADDRQKIFETLYSFYNDHKNLYGEIYNNILQGEVSLMKSRGYSSILEEHLAPNNIPTSVFHNLIEVASSGAEPLHEYYRLRTKYLGLSKHRSYDRFLQLAHSTKKYTYDDAKNLFWNSIGDFPNDFQEKAHEVLKDGYVDVYPKCGKRTGAYSNGGYRDGSDFLHPVILFNFVGNLDDCFTVAHESGHSIHTLYASENQPLMKQEYTIFTAEIASTFNEHNLLDYLLSKGNLDRETKICLLQKAIDEIVGTFYRQTLFAQFEYEISLLAEKGEPINYDVLCKKMRELYTIYYGIDIAEEKLKPLVWAYIPHIFYTPFYVYQYATSFTASMLLYQNVAAKKPQAFERYIGLLKSGGSDFPIAEVQAAGVDLTSKEPFYCVVSRMKELVKELAKTLNE